MGDQQQEQHDEAGERYDFCIVGAGPAGLATLSALSESYSLGENIHLNDAQWAIRALNKKARANKQKQQQRRKKRICVVDPNPNWLHSWDKNYETLEIEYLRSPVKAHPDAFDVNSLFAYAHSSGRSESELKESRSLGGLAGNKKLLPLGEAQVGMWDLPSSGLFRDFCDDILINRLPHDYLCGKVVDIDRCDQTPSRPGRPLPFCVSIDDGSGGPPSRITASAVVLAMGAIGRPIVPRCLSSLPPSKLVHWKNLKDRNGEPKTTEEPRRILVVGGGLTAVQTAQYALRRHPRAEKVVLCSRRPITEKNFDVSENWFDRRSSNRLIGEFYHRPVEERLAVLREARGGGSVPSGYMDEVRRQQAREPGRLVCLDGDIFLRDENHSGETAEEKKDCDGESGCQGAPDPGGISVTIVQKQRNHHGKASSCGATGKERRHDFEFDAVWLACGIEPDCTASPLVDKLLQRWPIPTTGGFPSVSEDLEWCPDRCPNLLVVGSLSSLNTGPDAANLMGIRRSAAKAANSLDCRSWLRVDGDDPEAAGGDQDSDHGHGGGGVLTNPFKHLQWGDSDSDTEDDSSECSCCEEKRG